MWEYKYILAEDGKTPLVEPDVIKWAQWFEKAERHVGFNTIGKIKISTVFLGMDQRWNPHSMGPPILWKTMIFGATGDLEHYQERYTSYQDAVRGHNRAILLAAEHINKQ